MKHRKTLFVLPIALGLFLSACGGNGGGTVEPPATETFEGVQWYSIQTDYSGQEYILPEVSGNIPEGTAITYTGREPHTDVGTYPATAKLSKAGYVDLTLNATLKIFPATFDWNDYHFVNKTVAYDGNDHFADMQLVGDVPDGTTITITATIGGEAVTSCVDVGTYAFKCKFENPNYNPLTLSAYLAIAPATFEGLTLESVSVKYDGEDHINDVQLTGVRPEGTSVSMVVKNSEEVEVSQAIDVGVYTYTCIVSRANYETLTLEATLTIQASRKDSPIDNKLGVLYFNNVLDNNYLYGYKPSDKSITLLDHASAQTFDDFYSSKKYVTSSLFINSVRRINTSGVDSLFTAAKITGIASKDSYTTCVAVQSIKESVTGLYLIELQDDGEPEITLMKSGVKARNLHFSAGVLYFINESDNDHLYRLDLSSFLIRCIDNEKSLHEFVEVDRYFICSINGLVNDSIGKWRVGSADTISNGVLSAGKYLCASGDWTYYYYNDLYSVIEPSYKGIWRVNTSNYKEQICHFDHDILGMIYYGIDNDIYYISAVDNRLYCYDIDTGTTTDVLDGFVAPEETPLNTGGKTISKGTKTYYLNMYAGKSLWVYDEKDGSNVQLTSNKVEDFFFIGDDLYINQVSLFVDNDIYKVNARTGGGAELINSNDLRNMYHLDGDDYIYGTHYNALGAAGGIARMKLDGSDYQIFSDHNGAKNFTIRYNKLYFINCPIGQDNGYLQYINIADIKEESSTISGTRLSNNIKNVKQYIFDGNNIFYIYNGVFDNSIRRTDFTSLGEGVEIASANTNPSEILLYGDYVYYYSYATSAVSSAGFYRVKKNASGDGTQELLVACDSTYYGTSLSISSSGNLYFLNYLTKYTLGDAHFYQIELSTNTVTKIN